MIKKLAKIETIGLNWFDRGILVVNAYGKYEDGWCQGFLNHVLDSYDKDLEERVGTASGMNFLIDLLKFFGVDNLTEVEDYICYVLIDDDERPMSRKVLGFEQLHINPNKRSKLDKVTISDYFGNVE